MNVLGLHFGHDGSICIVRDGNVATNILRERISRRKHALTVDQVCLDIAFKNAGLSLDSIDFIALTSTQSIDLLGGLVDGFSITPDQATSPFPRPSEEYSVGLPGFDAALALPTHYVAAMTDPERAPFVHPADRALFREFAERSLVELGAYGVPKRFPGDRLWPRPLGFAALAESIDMTGGQLREFGFHLPVTVCLGGQCIPGAFIHHHLCHAASSFYRSPFRQAAVYTQDGHFGGATLNGGGFFWGEGKRLLPITPHYSPIGNFYEEVGQMLCLGALTAPGKLMGLAPYGRPRHAHPRYVGNIADLAARRLYSPGRDWLIETLRALQEEGADLGKLGRSEWLIAPLNADIAASAQWIFEETRLAAALCLSQILDRLGLKPEGLCLSGGVSLNCPANTRLAMEGPIRPIYAEPNCDDGGLAAGAALYLTHHLLGLERAPLPGGPLPPCREPVAPHPYASANPLAVETILHALENCERPLRWVLPVSAANAAAKALASNKLVGWVQGPSEVGPRALGRRSLLADPRDGNNWARVNRAKLREAWRPFAPAVLESAAADWFEDMPLPSPYMLFTGRVRSDRLPAITHVDGTARVQTVADDDIPFADLLRHFKEITGVPVVLNTSLNGPGEPIVEHPEEALSLLARGTIDVLFIGPFQVEVR